MEVRSSSSTSISVPSVAKPSFTHQPLCGNDLQIRLVKIVPGRNHDPTIDATVSLKVEHVNLIDVGPHKIIYRALSYTWGSSSEDLYTILMNKKIFKIRRNLYNFLTEVQFRENGYFWIDMLSIDQANVEERNHQVALMSEIFSKAEAVYAWLGPAFPGSEDAMRLIDHYEAFDWPEPLPSESDAGDRHAKHFWKSRSDNDRLALVRLLNLTYWSRVWIVQELFLASSIILVCGSKSVGIDIGHRNDRYMYGRSSNLPFAGMEDFLGDDHLKGAFHSWDLLRCITAPQYGTAPQRCMSWTTGVYSSIRRDCNDERDHIFGIQACLQPTQRIPVDYSLASADVYKIFRRKTRQTRKRETADALVALAKAMAVPVSRRLRLNVWLLRRQDVIICSLRSRQIKVWDTWYRLRYGIRSTTGIA